MEGQAGTPGGGPPMGYDPQSPLEYKPDTASLIDPNSPTGSPSGASAYPPNHPLSGSKHFCSICGDRASGKHYGVFSCEGCKGFFKRTVRKELTYVCRERKECVIDKRQRNRCQYCRYMKCLSTGMKREAVQDERNRSSTAKNEEPAAEVEAAGGEVEEMSIDRIREAEEAIAQEGARPRVTKQGMLRTLINWANKIPFFKDLKYEDQLTLIRSGWNELLIAGFSFNSTSLPEEGIKLSEGVVITKEDAHMNGVGEIFDRVVIELIGKMKEVDMDMAELGCLRAIVLFNPDARHLDEDISGKVEKFREKVYSTLERYCRTKQQSEISRFAKLLLRLPALRSIGLKCVEHLFFYKLIKDDESGPLFNSGSGGSASGLSPIDAFIQGILEN